MGSRIILLGDEMTALKLHEGWGLGSYKVCLEVRCTYNPLSNCSCNPIISRATVVMGLIISTLNPKPRL